MAPAKAKADAGLKPGGYVVGRKTDPSLALLARDEHPGRIVM